MIIQGWQVLITPCSILRHRGNVRLHIFTRMSLPAKGLPRRWVNAGSSPHDCMLVDHDHDYVPFNHQCVTDRRRWLHHFSPSADRPRVRSQSSHGISHRTSQGLKVSHSAVKWRVHLKDPQTALLQFFALVISKLGIKTLRCERNRSPWSHLAGLQFGKPRISCIRGSSQPAFGCWNLRHYHKFWDKTWPLLVDRSSSEAQ